LGALVLADPALRALVVDDSAVIRELITVNLELEGFEVTTADDGLSALELAVKVQPDVITLDVMMPRMSGFEAVVHLREDPRTATIPVVMVTGRAQAADLERGDAVGVDAYLTKPFEPTELVEVVTRLARGRRGDQAGSPDTLDR
jgi:CheY-like chemotaxis protein